jgi:uncharacterized repeat protein (TIGR03803 family)
MKTIRKTRNALSGLTTGLRLLATNLTSASIGRCWFTLLACAACWVPLVALRGDAQAEITYQRLKSFGKPASGVTPYSGLIQGTDGALYGTTQAGGSIGGGTVFKVNADGTGFSVLKNLDPSTTGYNPYGSLVQGADGALYGTALYGGSDGGGTVFKLNTDGTGFAVLKNLDYSTTGYYPYGTLIQGTDGALYGTALYGGSFGTGTAFKLNTDGTGFSVLVDFDYSNNGGYPYAGLKAGTDGKLYGVASEGGSNYYGTVFTLDTDGSGFTVLKNLDYFTSGGFPLGSELLQGADGTLYGTTSQGGSSYYGTVFKLNPDGTGFSVLKGDFDYSTTGASLAAGLKLGTDGALYGTARAGGSDGYGTLYKLNTDGTGFTVLKNFTNADGASPEGGELTQATDGTLYGTTPFGGSSGYGTAFKLNTDGTGFSVFLNFSYAANSAESGGYPYAGVVMGIDGALYGTTSQGGSNDGGTVFRMNTDGTGFVVVKNLNPATEGSAPYGNLIQGTDGGLYGTTSQGGSNGYGTLFRFATDETGFSVVASFDLATTGGNPFAGLKQGTDGALYGTTSRGGIGGYGTVFKVNTNGTGFTVLKAFDYSTTGGYLYWGGLIQGTDGALYGTASQGGSGGGGTVFKLNTNGTGFTVLKNFDDYATTGLNLYTGLMQGADGALYGTTNSGGSLGAGTLFKLNTNGTGFSVLANLDGTMTGGYNQGGGLVQATDGTIFGTALYGGSGGQGTLYQLNADGTDFSVQFNFEGSASGSYPFGSLIRGTDGFLYSTTLQGGDVGFGTVFRIITGNVPPVAKCKNVTVSAGCGTTANASIDDGSYDLNGDVLTFMQTPAGPYPIGQTTVTLTVTDPAGAFDTCESVVTVTSNLFATGGIIWGQPLARTGNEDTDPSAGNTVKYRFKYGKTIPIQVRALGCTGDVTGNSNVTGTVVVFGDTDCAGVADTGALPIDFNGQGGPGGVMDKSDGKLKYNLDTGSLPNSLDCFVLQVTITDTSTGETMVETVLLQAK